MSHFLTLDGDKSDIALCGVTGGSKDGEVIFITENQHKGSDAAIQASHDFTPFLTGLKHRDKVYVNAELNAHLKNPARELSDLAKPFIELIKAQSQKKITHMDVADGTLLPLPDDTLDRDVIGFFGAAGSGKSYMCGKMGCEWRSRHPDSLILIVSAKESDPALDCIKDAKRMTLDDSLAREPVTLKDVQEMAEGKPCLMIFDDYDSLPKRIFQPVLQLLNDCMAVGRAARVSVYVTRHCPNAGESTKMLMNEFTSCFIYPAGSSAYSIKYLLMNYCNFGKDDLKKLMKLKSRWVYVRRRAPCAIVAQHECYLMRGNDD